MRPDITARFRRVVARAIERADREEAERLAAIRAIPMKRVALRNPKTAKPAETSHAG